MKHPQVALLTHGRAWTPIATSAHRPIARSPLQCGRVVVGSNHVIWNRTPTSMVGRLATVLIQMTGDKPVAGSLRKALGKLERPPTP